MGFAEDALKEPLYSSAVEGDSYHRWHRNVDYEKDTNIVFDSEITAPASVSLLVNQCNDMYEEFTPTEPSRLSNWVSEARIQIGIGFPIGLSSFCRMLMSVTDLSMLGHLENGTNYLAAAAMADVIMDITLTFPTTAADTLNALCSQAHGARNMKMIGRWLQLNLIISILMCIPVSITLTFTEQILLTFGSAPEIASLANTFALWSLWGIFPNMIYYSIRQYFQAQNIVLPALYNNMAFLVVNLILNMVLIHGIGSWSGLGFIGSPIATSVSRTLQLVLFLGYSCVWKKLHLNTWPAEPFFKSISQLNFREYINQTLPTMMGNAAEQWQMEVVTLMASSLGMVDVATQSSVFNIFFTFNCLSFGLAKATTCRVGYHLGANHAASARESACVSVVLSLCCGVAVAILFFAFRPMIGHLISNDSAVWADSASLVTVLALSYVGLSQLISLTAILFGQGRPTPVALVCGACSWLLSLPLAYLFAFKFHQRLIGLWLGLCCGYFIATLILGVIVYRTNWQHYASKAILRSKSIHRIVQ